MRRLSVYFIALGLGLIMLLAAGCDSEPESEGGSIDEQAVQAGDSDKSPEHLALERQLNDVLTRLRYGDKTGLYENEFEYFRDDYTYDDYLAMGQIRYAEADSIDHLDVRHIEWFDRDSALVSVTVNFLGPTGKRSFHRDRMTVYYHQGQWIKPTLSVIDLQLDYENKIRIADSVAAAEAAQGY